MIKFGPSGNSIDFYDQGYQHTWQAMKWVSELGLTAFEYPCGKGVKIGAETCAKISEEAKKYHISLSLHAPYYINLANIEEEKRKRSIEYIFESLKALKALGGNRLVLHCGYYMKQSPNKSIKLIKDELTGVIERMDAEGYGDILLCPETLGKSGQFGTLAEIIEICKLSPQFVPCIDFGHLYARSLGKVNSTEQFEDILQQIANALGEEVMRQIHIHFSHIEFTKAGEKVHHTLSETKWGPDFDFLAKALIHKKCEPVIICESREVMATDAVIMQNIYNSLKTAKD